MPARSTILESAAHRYLILRTTCGLSAVPLECVETVTRLLPMRLIEDPPVIGVATVRGKPTPVVDLGAALGEPGTHTISRLVTLRVGERTVGLAVADVSGIRTLDPSVLVELPPLVRSMAQGYAERIGLLDTELLIILHSSFAIPDAVWDAHPAEGGVSSP